MPDDPSIAPPSRPEMTSQIKNVIGIVFYPNLYKYILLLVEDITRQFFYLFKANFMVNPRTTSTGCFSRKILE
ncbi:hypothetical protein KEJ18_00480 [Candidatus Bathyarchaeota archaeon]|nr:hypothetical protein [Candidatus Bathyarchaeota archaeon]